jgi:hypothetical protein
VLAAGEPAPPKPPGDHGPRRRQTLDQETLRKQLASVPELALREKTAWYQLNLHGIVISPPTPVRYARTRNGKVANPDDLAANELTKRMQIKPMLQPFGSRETFLLFAQFQPELASLPWQLGEDCHLAREPAENLQALSRALRDLLAQVTPAGDTRPDPKALRSLLLAARAELPGRGVPAFLLANVPVPVPVSQAQWADPAAIPALLQLLMAERTPTRDVLVDVLAKIPGDQAVAALARLAIFDLAPEVRDRAILALRDRPAESYRPLLLKGLSYPWPVAADHAAEALVALEDRGAVSSLVGLLDDPDPRGSTTVLRNGKPTTLVRTLVKINHLKNCLLCHDPSRNSTSDLVRGRVPTPEQPLPPPKQYYGGETPGLFVRAEVTYLRQDFSVTQPVEATDPWPTQQRFDYLVSERLVDEPDRTRKDTPEAGEEPRREPAVTDYPQRESVLFALRELTGKDLGSSSRDWRDAVPAAGPGPAGRPPRH